MENTYCSLCDCVIEIEQSEVRLPVGVKTESLDFCSFSPWFLCVCVLLFFCFLLFFFFSYFLSFSFFLSCLFLFFFPFYTDISRYAWLFLVLHKVSSIDASTPGARCSERRQSVNDSRYFWCVSARDEGMISPEGQNQHKHAF